MDEHWLGVGQGGGLLPRLPAWLFLFANDPFPPGKNSCLGTVGQVQLAENIADMPFDGLFA
jgi:hypothetical protein